MVLPDLGAWRDCFKAVHQAKGSAVTLAVSGLGFCWLPDWLVYFLLLVSVNLTTFFAYVKRFHRLYSQYLGTLLAQVITKY